MRFLFILCGLLLSAPAPAAAEGSNLSYTTKGARKERTGGHMNYKALQYGAQDPKADAKPETEEPPQDEQAADQAWERYKALAAGTYKDPVEEEEAPAKKSAQADAADAAAPTGLAGILEQYSRNKQQRSQMRTIRVAPEKAEEKKEEKTAEKPEEKPEQKAKASDAE